MPVFALVLINDIATAAEPTLPPTSCPTSEVLAGEVSQQRHEARLLADIHSRMPQEPKRRGGV